MPFGKPIPGETPLEKEYLACLKTKGITTRSQLNKLEAENIRKVVVKYLSGSPTKKTAPFDFAWCLKLHKEMFGDAWTWAGVIRRRDLNIGIAFGQIEPSLYNLMGDLKFWAELPLIEQAARLHHKAVEIHPFENGNGRWSRMLANIWLNLNKHPLTNWPEETVGERSVIREEYIAAVQAADNGDYAAINELHRRFTSAS